MAEPTLDEIETHFHITASDRSKVEVYSDDPVWQQRLEKITQPIRVKGRGRWYELHIDQFVIRAGKRKVSDEQRAAFAERMRLMRNGTTGQGATPLEIDASDADASNQDGEL